MRSLNSAPALQQRHEPWAVLTFALCLIFLLADRWLVLHQFGFRYVDDDQAIMWNGAMEMAHGRFHEPCFYGQRYNTMLEGLLAVPLLWIGVGPQVALPTITSLLALFPFLLLAWSMFQRRAYALAAMVAILPVTLPPEYGMITCMPRGFVTGIFLSSVAMVPLFWKHAWAYFFATFFSIIGLFANPNAALVLAPVGLLILWENYAERKMYILGVLGALPAGLLCFFALRFYDLHPTYIVHKQWALDFHPRRFHIDHLRFLDELSPILWGKGSMNFIVLLVLMVLLGVMRQWKSAVALFVGIALIILSFGFDKVHDGIPSVFYPWARMFLAVPVMIALFVTRAKWSPHRWVVVSIPFIGAGFFGFKCLEQSAAVDRQIDTLKLHYMDAAAVDELERYCGRIGQLTKENQVDLLVVSWGYRKHLTNYGCPCLLPDFPTTMEPQLDRRTWWLRDIAPRVANNILFSGIPERDFRELSPPFDQVKLVWNDPELLVLKGNTERIDSMLVDIRIGMREH